MRYVARARPVPADIRGPPHYMMTTTFFHNGGFFNPMLSMLSKIYFFLTQDAYPDPTWVLQGVDFVKPYTIRSGSQHVVRYSSASDDLLKGLDLSSVMSLAPIGMSVPVAVEQDLKSRVFPGLQSVINYYSMTELGILVCSWPDQSKIGVLADGIEVMIVDPDSGNPVGPNETGEILAKTPCMMAGYINRPEDSRAFFNRDDGFCHTGDWGTYDELGVISFNGRKKELIKYLNNHLYPKEFEEVLQRHPDVVEVGVFGVEDPNVQELVTAAVVLKPGSKATEKEIVDLVEKEFANDESVKRLHGGVVFVEKLPRNNTGKIQKNILRDLYKNK